MVDVRNTYAESLSNETLFRWHTMLMLGDQRNIEVGTWRTHQEPMRVISGPIGRTKIHFEAPPSNRITSEMEAYNNWFNRTAPGNADEIKNPVVRSALAHLYFESIHPFEDGNGRIGRAISEKALSQGLGRPTLLSLSETIEANKKDYYQALKTGQQSNEITSWIIYLSDVTLQAQKRAEENIDFILRKTKFFNHFSDQLNDRHLKAIRRMFDAGLEGFTGGMTQKKYVAITKASTATATRDLKHLSDIGALKQIGGGRSTRYELCL